MKIPKSLLRLTIFSRWYILEDKKKNEIKNRIAGIFKLKGCQVKCHNFEIDWDDIRNRAMAGFIQGGLAASIGLFLLSILMFVVDISSGLLIGVIIGSFIGNFIYRFCVGE